MSNLILYYLEACPYCHKVIDYLSEQGIEIPKKEIHDSVYREELIEIGGKKQVPCLLIDGKALYESNDIIQWLKDNLSSNEIEAQEK